VVERVDAPGSAEHVGQHVRENVAECAHGALARRRRSRRVVVELGGRDDHVRAPVAGHVSDGGRVDDLGSAECRIRELAREARYRRAGPVPRVDVLVERGRHDVEAAVTVEVGERRRADEPALDVVGARAVLRPGEGGIEAHGEPGHG